MVSDLGIGADEEDFLKKQGVDLSLDACLEARADPLSVIVSVVNNNNAPTAGHHSTVQDYWGVPDGLRQTVHRLRHIGS